MDNTIVDRLMRDKRSVHGEIAVVLFEHCNLSCSFCPQDHNSKAGMEDIFQHLINVREALKHLDDKQYVTLNIQGGELFSDAIPNSLFEDYFDFARAAYDYASYLGINLQCLFGTNLVHTKTQRVLDLFTRIKDEIADVNLAVSYDPASRFSRCDFELFQKNIEIYSEHIKAINITLTKPNIRKFLAGEAKFFDILYERYPCVFDYYQLERNKVVNAPTDFDLQAMFLLLAEKYPKASPIAGYFENQRNDSVYQHTENAMDGRISGFCDANVQGKIFQDSDVTFEQMEAKFLEDMDCMSCKWFERCGLGGIPQHYFQPEYQTLPDCWQKTVHEYIDKKARA